MNRILNKSLLTLISVLTIEFLSAQNIDFSLKIFDTCKKQILVDSIFYLTDTLGNSYFSYSINEETYELTADTLVVLPNPGLYYLHIMDNGFEYLNDSIKINIPDTKSYNKIVNNFLIQERLKTNHSTGFYNCDGLLNGYHKDFYKNGSLRLKGNFIDGEPVDSLIYYHDNGVEKKSYIYSKRFIYIREFDKEGRLIFRGKNSRKHYYLSDYVSKYFFPNGQLKRIEKRRNNISRIKENYLGNSPKIRQSKNRRKIFFKNGQINIEYSRKRIFHLNDFLKREYNYKVKMVEYSENGKVLVEAKYYFWGGNQKFSDFDIDNSDWIASLKKYKNGILVLELNDCDTKEYFK